LDDATLRSLLPPEERKTIIETAERCLVAKAPRGSRTVGIEAGHHIPASELHKLIEECLLDDSKAGARGAFLLCFLPRKPKNVGQESDPENVA
jgi:hypothetical protein